MINLKVKATFVHDTLRGDTDIVIRVELLEVMTDRYEDEDDWKSVAPKQVQTILISYLPSNML